MQAENRVHVGYMEAEAQWVVRQKTQPRPHYEAWISTLTLTGDVIQFVEIEWCNYTCVLRILQGATGRLD